MPTSTTDFQLHQGDCIEVMRGLPDNSVDAVVCDPPYELGFMGKSWDASGIAYNVDMWREALRVLKHGGHMLAFSGSRTYHRMVCAIEDAGFEIRDQIMWVYGSGFPKSLDVSKAIDKAAGAEREVVGQGVSGKILRSNGDNERPYQQEQDRITHDITAPATEAAKQWEGWGTALKPAHEPICVARKPLVGTVAANVLAHGTGAINIDGCRVAGAKPDTTRGASAKASSMVGTLGAQGRIIDDGLGRWPANLIHDGSDEVVALFPTQAGGQDMRKNLELGTRIGMGGVGNPSGSNLPNGRLYGDAGSAARFFYCAKASRADRNEGLPSSDVSAVAHQATMREREDADWSQRNGNYHPTVKPTDLMAYLCRLVTPPNGTVLDPFMGSGSTGKAAIREGFNFIGIEREAEYMAIARARIEHEHEKVVAASNVEPSPQLDLFAGAA